MRAVVTAALIGFAGPVVAQPAAGLTAVMEACRPIAATGDSIRAQLTLAGWAAQDRDTSAQQLRDLVGSHMWTFIGAAPQPEQLAQVDDYVTAIFASLNDPAYGQIYTADGEVALVLNQNENLSCFWAGAADGVFAAQVDGIGGFPGGADALPPRTASLNQTVGFADRDWTRLESYGLHSDETKAGPYPAAAFLGRSPV